MILTLDELIRELERKPRASGDDPELDMERKIIYS